MSKSKQTAEKRFVISISLAAMVAQILLLPLLQIANATSMGIPLLETPDEIIVTPNPTSIHIPPYPNSSVQFTATAVFYRTDPTPDETADITSDPLTTWDTPDTAFATVDSTGEATGVAYGFATINATYGGVTGSALLEVEAPDSIVVTPNPASVDEGDDISFTATAVFDRVDPTPDEMFDVTTDSLTNWSSDNLAIATVNSSGVAHGVSGGTVIIRADHASIQGTSDLTVVATATPPPPPPPPPGTPPPPSAGGSAPPPPPAPEPEPEPAPTPEPTPPPPPPPPTPGPPAPGEEEFAPSPEGEIPPGVSPEEFTPGPPPSEVVISAPPGPTPEPLTYQQLSPIFLPPELSVTRGEILDHVITEFGVEDTKAELISSCVANINDCLSIFLSVSKYEGIIVADAGGFNLKMIGLQLPYANAAGKFDLGHMQLYPDVDTATPANYAINLGTLLGIVQGYYEETSSPFKPYQIITRMEAVKVLLGSVDLSKWLYYDELETTLGGAEGVKLQTTPFADIFPSRDYMWWYPRYLSKGCEVGMIDCTPGSNFRPDEFITDAEMEGMILNLKDYLYGSGYLDNQTGDPDSDTIKTYIEDTIYFTDHNDPDTDSDELHDNEEVQDYKTSPFLKDTDTEGLSDFEEVKTYGTNPLKMDTDEDDYSDSEEVRFGSDPLDPLSSPEDLNGNHVADSWEKQYGIDVKDGVQDTDVDGVSDRIEFQVGTNPLQGDTDEDTFSDAEELLELYTDPLDPTDPGTLDAIGVRITSFQENQLVGDSTPLIKGIAPLHSTVRLVLRNDYGHEKILGDASVDENNLFIFQVDAPIRDGRYMVVAKALRPELKQILVSDPVHIVIDSTLAVDAPVPKKLADTEITPDVILKNLRVEVRDRHPVLIGETEFGSKVTATWRSIVTTSALIADTANGEFEISSPRELELGEHEVYVQAARKKDGAQSDTVKVLFEVGVSFGGDTTLKGTALQGKFSFGSFADFAKNNAVAVIVVTTGLISLAGAGVYLNRGGKLPWKK